ncbi:DUF1571 domain-containing protein [Thalassoglobus polymorphus]|uniref:DUF1571 domain-containing protein n=1 Tax=Thalassoglobus polymorphus TaxID=2527994 RepID=A0A517QGY0_9PLAN|nr:DUF1571 domain-containing protein [Thalassoglobus polymorphus]QDT30892.1 hypothetical protein Mal48_01200 [Thalassoglobus polymorphus]
MSSETTLYTRRRFVLNSVVTASALGAGALLGNKLFADPSQIASRVQDAPSSHPLIPALQMGTNSLKALDDVKDYTATFTKREMIGRNLTDAKMEMKYRHNPYSVYFKFISPSAGREAIYVAGENDGKMQAHEVGIAGLAGTLSLDVDGRLAMTDNRHPITMAGMHIMVSTLLEQWLSDTKLSGMTVNFYPNAKIGKIECKAIETSHRSPSSGAKYAMSRLYVDASTNYPIRVQQYEFPRKNKKQPELVEDYLYTDIKTNVGLKDIDFSTSNSKYDF